MRTALVLWLLSLYALYWIIRLGVQHGIEARDRRRAETRTAGTERIE